MRAGASFLAVLAAVAWLGCTTQDEGSSPDATTDALATDTGLSDPGSAGDTPAGDPCAAGGCTDLGPAGTDAFEATDPAAPDDLPDVPDVPAGPYKDYLIIVATGLEEAAAEYAAWRETTGHRVEVVRVEDLVSGSFPPMSLVQPVRNRVKALQADLPAGHPVFVLLLGDDEGGATAPAGSIPALGCDNDYGDCYTDNTYADLDGDNLPDVPLGRIPARTPQEVRTYLAKVKAFETTYNTGLWNRRVSMYTGQANFGADIDALLEQAVMEGLKRVSHAFDINGTYDNPKSPYYYAPFDDKVRQLFNEGALMVVYVGHGSTSWTEGLDADGIAAVHCQNRPPFAFFFACYNGNFVEQDDGLADLFTWKPDGPVTVFGSMDVSHPYGNAVLAYEVQRAALDLRPATIGEVTLAAKRGSIENDDEFRQFVDGVAVIQVPVDEQARLKVQHLDLYNLVGDPAVPMRYPQAEVVLDPIQGHWKDGSLQVSGTVPGVIEGSARVTFETERDVILEDLAKVDPNHPDVGLVQQNWATAINKVVVGQTVPVHEGRFQASLAWDRSLPGGDYYVKVYAEDGAGTDAFGVADAP